MKPAAGRLRALVVDDERLLREQLKTRLADVWPDLEVIVQGARRVCQGEGFTGGPVAMAQYLLDGLDANVVCQAPRAR